jgi:fimbrial chaperone protein
MRALIAWCCALLSALLSASAVVAQVGVAPIRVDFVEGRLSGSITLSNDSNRTLTMQPTPMLWQQDAAGADQLTPTRDFIAAPPLIEIPPGQKQVIRVALRAAEPKDRERQYRLLVREVPPPRAEGSAGLQFALNLSIPVFAYPAPGKTPPTIAVSAAVGKAPAALELTIKNTGVSHLQTRELRLLSGSDAIARQETMMYVLPGASKTLAVPFAAGVNASHIASKQLVAEIVNSRDTIRTEISVK